MNKIKNILLILPLVFSFALFFPTNAHAGDFATVRFNLSYRTISGMTYDLNGATVYARSTKSNDYKWVSGSANACEGCHTCSVKGGSKIDGYNCNGLDFGASKTIHSDANGHAYFEDTFSCGHSTCATATDKGTCNPFRFSIYAPSTNRYGQWKEGTVYKTSPGDKSFDVDLSVTNGSTITRSYTYFERNRIPSAVYVSPANNANISIPAGSTTAPVTFSGRSDDLDTVDKGAIIVSYKKIKNSAGSSVTDTWHSFGSVDIDGPDGVSQSSKKVTYSTTSTASNNVKATMPSDINSNGWRKITSTGISSTSNSEISFLPVQLDAGTYQWSIGAYDGHDYSGWKTTYRTFAVVGGGNPLNVDISGDGSGSVTDSASKINCSYSGSGDPTGDCSEVYSTSTNVVLTARPDTATSTFVEWQGACSGSGLTCSVAVDSAKSVTAVFKKTKSMTCSVLPTEGLSPLSIRVKVTSTGLGDTPKFNYIMDYQGSDEITLGGRGDTIYYTFSASGDHKIKVDWSGGAVDSSNGCEPTVTVTNSQDENGGSRS